MIEKTEIVQNQSDLVVPAEGLEQKVKARLLKRIINPLGRLAHRKEMPETVSVAEREDAGRDLVANKREDSEKAPTKFGQLARSTAHLLQVAETLKPADQAEHSASRYNPERDVFESHGRAILQSVKDLEMPEALTTSAAFGESPFHPGAAVYGMSIERTTIHDFKTGNARDVIKVSELSRDRQNNVHEATAIFDQGDAEDLMVSGTTKSLANFDAAKHAYSEEREMDVSAEQAAALVDMVAMAAQGVETPAAA